MVRDLRIGVLKVDIHVEMLQETRTNRIRRTERRHGDRAFECMLFSPGLGRLVEGEADVFRRWNAQFVSLDGEVERLGEFFDVAEILFVLRGIVMAVGHEFLAAEIEEAAG